MEMTTVFQCEESLDGILTGVYDAWASRLGHKAVRLETEAQANLELFCRYRQVPADLEKADKVLRTIRRRMGEEGEEAVCYAAACRDPRRADAIYRMIVLGLHLDCRGGQMGLLLQAVLRPSPFFHQFSNPAGYVHGIPPL